MEGAALRITPKIGQTPPGRQAQQKYGILQAMELTPDQYAQPILIRKSPAAQTIVVIFSAAWCGTLFFGVVNAVLHASAVAVILFAMLCLGAHLFYRIYRLAVAIYPEELVVRGYRGPTKRVSRETVVGFRVSPAYGQPFQTLVGAVLKDGTTVRLDAAGCSRVGRRGRASCKGGLPPFKHGGGTHRL